MTVKEALAPVDLSPSVEEKKVTRPLSQSSRDKRAIVALIAIPAAIFILADVFGGHLLLTGDNLVQNYPLRVLAATDLRHGILPFWNPYIWSGTPLLAGLNAGVFYPTTLLFVVLPAHVAWVLGQVFVYSATAVGTYLLFRSSGIRTKGAFLGAFSFAFAGVIATQTSVHIDMGEGLASLPWALYAIRRLGDDRRWRWAVLLTVAFVLAVLAGSPEAMLDTTVACLAFTVLRWSARHGNWRVYLSRIAMGAAVTVGITAFLWAPAIRFISDSQRPSGGEFFASTFSFPPWSGLLGLIPFLEGGYHLFGQTGYFGESNPEEVAFYVGILPAIAVFTLWTRPWRQRIPKGELRCWYGLFIVGAVLAIAASTSLEHLIYQIPFYGKQRDSGRNIVDVDLAGCALFAWWVDGGSRIARVRDREWTRWLEKALAFLPFVGIAIVAGYFIITPTRFWRDLGAFPPVQGAAGVGGAIALAAALAIVGGTIAVLRSRLRRATWMRWVGAFVVVDVALFSIGSAYFSSEQPPEPGHQSPVLSLVKANLSSSGRFAVFNPDLLDPEQFVDAGEPDIGALSDLPSFSGYTSLVDSKYSSGTNAQIRDFVKIGSLGAGLFKQTDLQVMVTVPESFLWPIATMPVPDRRIRVLAEQPGVDPVLPGGNAPPPVPPLISLGKAEPRADIAAGDESGWWFGTSFAIGEAEITLGQASEGQVVRYGILEQGGEIEWKGAQGLGTGNSSATFDLGGAVGAGVVIEPVSGPDLRAVRLAIASTSGHFYMVEGALSDALSPQKWTQVGFADDFAVFKARYQTMPAWLDSPSGPPVDSAPGDAPGTGTAQLVANSTNAATISVNTQRASLLVWSTAWDAGWHASMTVNGKNESVPVKRVGLVQGVDVPAGTSVVHFSYRPPHIEMGAAITALTAAVVAALVIAFEMRRRKRRRNENRLYEGGVG
ncbi:MAG: YfhO family protein [Acidimicrobiales bacterium]